MTSVVRSKTGRGSCRVGFGTWPLGGAMQVGGLPMGRGQISDDEAVALLHQAMAAGVDFIDTADVYGRGRAESLIGRAIRAHNLAPTICTKFGNRITDGGIVQDFSPQWLRQAVEASLGRLNVEKIDILLFHSPPDDFAWSAYDRSALESLVGAGKIGRYGVSCRSLRGAMKVLNARFGSVIEIIYNVIDRRAELEVLPVAEKMGTTIVSRCPLAYGLLAHGFERTYASDDHRSAIDATTRKWISDARQGLDFLDELPGGFAVSAIRFCLNDSRVSVVIPGLQKPAHLEAARLAGELGSLPEQASQAIRTAVPETYSGW